MRDLSVNVIDNKVILYSLLIAIVFHASLIPLSSLIKFKKLEELEPKIVLELINDINKKVPIKNNITPPEITTPEKILKPSSITPPKNMELKPTENTTMPIDLTEDIILPDNLKPLINNKIDIPKNIKKLKADILIDKLPDINKPEPITLNSKPIKTLNKPEIIVNSIALQPKVITDNLISQNINLPKKPIKQEVKEKEVNKQEEIKNAELTVNEINILENYKSNIRTIIQSFAINNYPKKDLRRRNEGIVHLIFKLKEDGNIDYINTGPNTKATDSLVNAAIDSVKKSAPFEQIKLLKKEKEFEISIIYKIN
ncbi:MAG: hypothetical protein CFH33_01683 [Alphaproteobacteria bacterium MarineAlpha9_Bin3]|nr:MAG: hypothetical protein CFH33_01683 [Alphaproteobacteria bacterium MarineAlpha9_Bin3]|tara:strand:- start:583 stop:1521 length:939 start_codon:yes stop_codon:yes gene_type:complete